MEQKYLDISGKSFSAEEADKILPNILPGHAYSEEKVGDHFFIFVNGVSFCVKSDYSPTVKFALRYNQKYRVKIRKTRKEIIVHLIRRHDALKGKDIAPHYISTEDYRTEYQKKELKFLESL